VLTIGSLGLVLTVATQLFRTPYSILVFAAALLLGAAGLLDRRARLTLSPAGIRYLRWGRSMIPWQEFRGYRWASWRGQPHLQLLPHRPAELTQGFSPLGRFEHFCARLLRAPSFAIAVAPLAATNDALEAAVGRFVDLQP
jgi:hypothetical protein